LRAYRSLLTGPQKIPGSSLVLPDSLLLLPRLVSGIIRHDAFRPDSDISPDERIVAMCRLSSATMRGFLLMVCPRLFALHLNMDVGIEGLERIASMEEVEENGVYLMTTGTHFAVWVSRRANDGVMKDLFGSGATATGELPLLLPLPSAETGPRATRAAALIRRLRNLAKDYAVWLPVVVLQQGSPLERTLFTKHLIEDDVGNNLSYPNVLCHINGRIQATS